MLPIYFTHGLALLSHYFKSITCVYSVMFSLQRRCMGVLCCYFRPKMFSPGDRVQYHSHTLGAHVLATVMGPSPNGPQFCHIQHIRPGGVTPVQPCAPLPPPHQPVQHTACLSCKLSMCNSVLFLYPEVLYSSFGSLITFVLDESHWHCINAKVASHVFSLLASLEGTTVCLEIPLQFPPPLGRPSLGDRPPPPTWETVAC